MELEINIPDEKLHTFCVRYGYQDKVPKAMNQMAEELVDNPVTTEEYATKVVESFIRDSILQVEMDTAAKAAAESKKAEVLSSMTIKVAKKVK